MDDSQWCLDECPTCATVVYGKSIYCSAKCEPDVEQEPELEHDYVPWSQSSSTRISAWAFDCYKSALTPASSPCIFPSPSQRKLHLRKQYPTSWHCSRVLGHKFDCPDIPYFSLPTAFMGLPLTSTAHTSLAHENKCLPLFRFHGASAFHTRVDRDLEPPCDPVGIVDLHRCGGFGD
ncbi:hypothetical protein C8R44DRAFT_884665 [Mycena epipterygia]|nr:hypothetical protein C8R44DRAFT_884665 [Mycena epipterygia]